MSKRRSSLRKGATVLFGFAVAVSTAATPPEVSAALKVPEGEQLILIAHASGVQIYACTSAPEAGLQWSLSGPEAQLADDSGVAIGRHFAGPTWQLKDGSTVIGKAIAHEPSNDAQAVAWLLLKAVQHEGQGKLSAVTSIQRVHTHGGQPPPAAQCTKETLSHTVRVPYTADYYFYAPLAH
jgi:hypothetical protein